MSEPMTDKEIADALALCEKATPGPWAWEPDNVLYSADDPSGSDPVINTETADGQIGGVLCYQRDADFIAAARTGWPKALAALKEERERSRKLARVLRALYDLQNGPPLIELAKEWAATMDEAYNLLAEIEGKP